MQKGGLERRLEGCPISQPLLPGRDGLSSLPHPENPPKELAAGW